jgi:hypothetical protein
VILLEAKAPGLEPMNAVAATGENPIACIVRHNLDPGELGAADQLQNLRAVREGRRVFYGLRAAGTALASGSSPKRIAL